MSFFAWLRVVVVQQQFYLKTQALFALIIALFLGTHMPTIKVADQPEIRCSCPINPNTH